ncbi:MAG: PfkB family carbohydrate kinase [Treponema sp.]|jgi:1-phosphofructokinase/tagatose 6-phosphate kinase|nr:PfkB family carbohydrate kinase [Treponema sp.]
MGDTSFLTVCMNPTLQKTLCFSRLIPDRVNRTGRYRLDASGKGINVTRVLTQLGKRCLHLTQLGGALRPLFLELCRADGLELEWAASGSPIRFCYTLIDEAAGSVTELVEESAPVSAGTEGLLLEAYRRRMPDYGTVIISGTKAAGFSGGLVPRMVQSAKERGKTVILDLRGEDLLGSLPYRPDIIKPNLDEFTATFAPDMPEAGIKERTAAICRELWERYEVKIILTRGKDSVWFAEAGVLEEYPVEAAPPVNTTGSGDAFTAGAAAALSGGASLRDAVAEGVRCGGLNARTLKAGVIQ